MYKTAMKVQPSDLPSTREAHVFMAVVLVFNAALAYQLAGDQLHQENLSNIIFVRKAIKLYRLAYNIYHEETIDMLPGKGFATLLIEFTKHAVAALNNHNNNADKKMPPVKRNLVGRRKLPTKPTLDAFDETLYPTMYCEFGVGPQHGERAHIFWNFAGFSAIEDNESFKGEPYYDELGPLMIGSPDLRLAKRVTRMRGDVVRYSFSTDQSLHDILQHHIWPRYDVPNPCEIVGTMLFQSGNRPSKKTFHTKCLAK